ncbi:hypothetical protein G210_3424 [Candida maltosa Xu316]|uniref:Uncharacterized protein n=1 Tax=Candida maltosa (strain Xu316) TaxID=1245528 RepID=M3J361_CANMX|nr:hypothetical protein G210_3424 [Candida maltosa Xu316]
MPTTPEIIDLTTSQDPTSHVNSIPHPLDPSVGLPPIQAIQGSELMLNAQSRAYPTDMEVNGDAAKCNFKTRLEFDAFIEDRNKWNKLGRKRSSPKNESSVKYVFYEEYKCRRNGIYKSVAEERERQTTTKCNCPVTIIGKQKAGKIIFPDGTMENYPVEVYWVYNHKTHSIAPSGSEKKSKRPEEFIAKLAEMELVYDQVMHKILFPYYELFESLSPLQKTNFMKIYFNKKLLIRNRLKLDAIRAEQREPISHRNKIQESVRALVSEINEFGYCHYKSDYGFKTPSKNKVWSITVVTRLQIETLEKLAATNGRPDHVLLTSVDTAHYVGLDFDGNCPTYLYLLTYRDNNIGVGIPLAWCLTNSLAKDVLLNLFTTMKGRFRFHPTHITTDYGMEYIEAIKSVFPWALIQSCHDQLVYAFRSKISNFIETQNKVERIKIKDRLCLQFSSLLRSNYPEASSAIYPQFQQEWNQKYTMFAQFFKTQWTLLAKYWFQQGTERYYNSLTTKNFAESFFTLLNRKGPAKTVDSVLYRLVKKIDYQYWPIYHSLQSGFIQPNMMSHREAMFKNQVDVMADTDIETFISVENGLLIVCDDYIVDCDYSMSKLICNCGESKFGNCLHIFIGQRYIDVVRSDISNCILEIPESDRGQFIAYELRAKLGANVGRLIEFEITQQARQFADGGNGQVAEIQQSINEEQDQSCFEPMEHEPSIEPLNLDEETNAPSSPNQATTPSPATTNTDNPPSSTTNVPVSMGGVPIELFNRQIAILTARINTLEIANDKLKTTISTLEAELEKEKEANSTRSPIRKRKNLPKSKNKQTGTRQPLQPSLTSSLDQSEETASSQITFNIQTRLNLN